VRWETPASVPILLPEPASGFHALQTIRVGSLDQRHRLDPPEILRYPEHEILIFLYFQFAGRCNPGFSHPLLHQFAPVETLQLGILVDRMHGSFTPQIAQ
jgi:hypothetical protein